jgi:hypothetical protein
MLLQFVVHSSPLGLQSWRLFTITSSSGVELFRAAPLATAQTGPRLASAIDVLFLTVFNSRICRFIS